MITKVLFGGAIALSAAVGVAAPVTADPSAFSTLSCACQGGATALDGAPTLADRVNDGIQSGLADLQGISG